MTYYCHDGQAKFVYMVIGGVESDGDIHRCFTWLDYITFLPFLVDSQLTTLYDFIFACEYISGSSYYYYYSYPTF